MTRILLAAGFAVLLFAAGANSVVKELAPGVWVRMGDRDRNQPANCGWVIFKDFVLVIDANFPWGAREILPEIKKTTNKPIRFVFNTHYHGDHAYGSSVFADEGAQLVCSQDCAQESRTKGQAGWDKNTATGDYSLKPYRLVHPAIVFGTEMAFDDGEHRVELRKAGPGHSKGDAVAWLPKERILFTGDLCVNWTSGNNVADADADHDNWIRTLDKMAQANPSTVVVGHGDLGGVPELRKQKEYLSDMLRVVREGIRAGKSGEEIANAADLTSHKIGTDPARNKASILAVHRKLTAK